MSTSTGRDLFTIRALKYAAGFFALFLAGLASCEAAHWLLTGDPFEISGAWILAALSAWLGFAAAARELHSELNQLHDEFMEEFADCLRSALESRRSGTKVDPAEGISDADIRYAKQEACRRIRRAHAQSKCLDIDWQLARMSS